MRVVRALPLLASLALLAGCGLFGPDLAVTAPPLHDMEEVVELLEEPNDEERRKQLPQGVFTGVYVETAGESLDEMEGAGPGIMVKRIIENSPGSAAGLEAGDILLEATVGGAEEPTELAWPSDWRSLELKSVAGDVFDLLTERAGVERSCSLTTVERVKPSPREQAERLREEQKVGIVVRTATEVEAREAELAPGAGAVVVGLARGSPWRVAGLQFRDLLTEVDGRFVAHPQVVLDVIREAEEDQEVHLVFMRDGERMELDAPVSRRAGRITEFTIPILFSHEKDRGTSETDFILGLLGWKSTPAAWEFKLLWFIRIRGGDADRLKEVK